MLQFFLRFFVIYSIFLLDQTKLRLVNFEKGLLQDIINFYDNFQSYMF